jgi:hypothetical protein
VEYSQPYARLEEEDIQNVIFLPQFLCKFVGWVQTIHSTQNYNKTIMAID